MNKMTLNGVKFAKLFAAAAFASALLCGCAGSESGAKIPRAPATSQTYTLSQKKLLEIVAAQNRFLEKIRGTKSLSVMKNSDLLSEKRRIDSLWNEYFTGEKRDAESFAIYGKYLRETSNSTAAYKAFRHPVALEEIRADAGLDIGGTLIGMHLKKVAVPVRLEQDHIGQAIVLAARVRPKFIGGDRAVYDETLKEGYPDFTD